MRLVQMVLSGALKNSRDNKVLPNCEKTSVLSWCEQMSKMLNMVQQHIKEMPKYMSNPRLVFLFFVLLSSLAYSSPALSAPIVFSLTEESVNVIWLATASALVFFMQAGFALLESGMSRAKNSINVVMKNYMDVCIGSIVFWAVGYGLMFGANTSGWFGADHFFLHDGETWDYSFMLFQIMFAATAATIASGAMAERAKFGSYLVGAILITGVIYPVFGSWAWGSMYEGAGWLAERGFIDFAGSSVVHSVGGWCALAAVIVLGPRLGRYDPKTGKAREIPGHNLNFVALGGLILWFGWFGFNGGSTVGADVNIGLINLNTQLAAAAGAIGACIISLTVRQPILVTNVVNGSLAGLVSITAGCASMEPVYAIVTGFFGGVIALLASYALIAKGCDDVVGAVSVHGVAGAWGTLCAGLFYSEDMFNTSIIMTQLLGIAACFVWAFGLSFLIYWIIERTMGLRAESIHEQRGLDITEHSEVGYPEFVQGVAYNKQSLHKLSR